jgi:hypothetical protein
MNSSDKDLFIIYSDSTGEELHKLGCFSGEEFTLLSLARGIASSPLWSIVPASTLLVRQFPPLIAVLGNFERADEARLSALAHQVNYGLRTLRYIGYSGILEDCRILADRLQQHLGKDGLKRCFFTGLPRGGLIVLGILSYLLELEPEQLEYPKNSDSILVVVDDCAISGLRFGNFLGRRDNNHLIFTPLYSHPELRSAIEKMESRVIACISARDLSDSAMNDHGHKQAFQELWQARFGEGKRYWIGLPEYICFPWNEPDRPFWNPVLDTVESGWTIIPPELCIKNKSPMIPIEIQPLSHGTLRPTGRVTFAMKENSIILGDLGSMEIYSLEGLAADIWTEVIRHGDLDLAIKNLSTIHHTEESVLRDTVMDFVDELITQGILEQQPA